jgi:LacI family transcriptional regulator
MDDSAEGRSRAREGRGRALSSPADRGGMVASPHAATGSRRPTMTDVAQIAGVSQSSVSLALNEMVGARISQATRVRVIEAARSIGYELPSARRASLIGVGRVSIAYLVDEISTSPHPVVNLDGARDAAWESGHLVTAHVTRSNRELEAFTIQAIKRDSSVIAASASSTASPGWTLRLID